jgi:uracil-DNA glycosylase
MLPGSVPSIGPAQADILILGDFASADDVWKARPLAGQDGSEFAKMLHEAGILVTECHMALAFPFRPPRNPITKQESMETLWTDKKTTAKKLGLSHQVGDYFCSPLVASSLAQLSALISEVQPKVIIALGNFALWAIRQDLESVHDYRGSLLESPTGCVVIPTYHPRMVLKVWEWRSFSCRDLQRVRDYVSDPAAYAEPNYNFRIAPDFQTVINTLNWLTARCNQGPTHISCDIETIARHISCVGFGWSKVDALCVPLVADDGEHYWPVEQEIAIAIAMKRLFLHKNCLLSGQNFSYDDQHLAKHFGFLLKLRYDTMLMQHVLFPGLPKDLAFISSMYCHFHRYWKDDLKDYNRVPGDMNKYWTYNCKDCCTTWEAAEVLMGVLDSENMWAQYEFLMTMWPRVQTTMYRGVRINQKARSEVAGALMAALQIREFTINQIVGRELNVGSPVQMQKLFYDELGQPKQYNRKTKRPTCDDDALQKIKAKEPLLAPLVDLIAEKRSLGVFLSTFCLMPLDSDSRMRTAYNLGGTETLRLNSGENAFGNGGNLQNIPKGDEK